MHWTATTSDLAAALLDPVRGVIERGLAGHELALDSVSEAPQSSAPLPAWSTTPRTAPIATHEEPTATTKLPAAYVPPAPTLSPHSDGRTSAHHEPRPAPSSPPGATPHASGPAPTTAAVLHPARTNAGHAAPRPLNREHSPSAEIAAPHREHATAPHAGLERPAPSGRDTNDEHSPPPVHSALRLRHAYAEPPPNSEHTPPTANYEHTAPPANYLHSPAPANHEHSAARALHEPATLADRQRSVATRPPTNDEHSPPAPTRATLDAPSHGQAPPAAAAPAAMTPAHPAVHRTPREPGTSPSPTHPAPTLTTAAASPPIGVPIRPSISSPLAPRPDRRDLDAARQLTGALRPVLDDAAALTTAALARADEPRVANHFAVQVQVGAQAGAVDPDALTTALLTLLREAAYRHGLEVE